MTEVFVAFDLRGGSASLYDTFLAALKKRKWRVAKGPALTVFAKFKPAAGMTRIKTVLQEDFDACAQEVGKDYSAAASIGERAWSFKSPGTPRPRVTSASRTAG